MSTKTGIEWTDATWNPIAGCSLVSPGCTNCYAMGEAHRLGERLDQAKYKGLTRVVNGKPVWTGEVRVWEKALLDPLKWRKPKRVFAVMALAPQHTFQVLTKRPERMREYLRATDLVGRILAAACRFDIVDGADLGAEYHAGHDDVLPLPNVWLGVSVEDQRRADERIPILLDTPAAVRWLSAEPLLGPVDLTGIDTMHFRGAENVNALVGFTRDFMGEKTGRVPSIDWVVAGGESGPDARPMHPAWAQSLRDQCAHAGVAFLFKQWGSWAPVETPASEIQEDEEIRGVGVFIDNQYIRKASKKATGRTLDGRTHDEYPQVRA
jgi:protein gp37